MSYEGRIGNKVKMLGYHMLAWIEKLDKKPIDSSISRQEQDLLELDSFIKNLILVVRTLGDTDHTNLWSIHNSLTPSITHLVETGYLKRPTPMFSGGSLKELKLLVNLDWYAENTNLLLSHEENNKALNNIIKSSVEAELVKDGLSGAFTVSYVFSKNLIHEVKFVDNPNKSIPSIFSKLTQE